MGGGGTAFCRLFATKTPIRRYRAEAPLGRLPGWITCTATRRASADTRRIALSPGFSGTAVALTELHEAAWRFEPRKSRVFLFHYRMPLKNRAHLLDR